MRNVLGMEFSVKAVPGGGRWRKASAPSFAPMQRAEEESAKFERGVLCHVVGTLLAWSFALVAYLMFQLWHDYISTIPTAFIVSQTLHTQRAQLVSELSQPRVAYS